MTSPVELEVEPFGIASRTGISIVAAVPTTDAETIDALFVAVGTALADFGLGPEDVVRNRVLAASRPARDTVSAQRFRTFAGAARCATSSYIDGNRFIGGDGVRLDTIALRGTAATKMSVERDPPEPPCLFVATEDLVFLSGLTSADPELHIQIQRIRDRLAETLSIAGERLGRPVRATSATVFVHRSVGLDELADLSQMVGIVGIPLAVGRCDGFSKPGKLLELEIDAEMTGVALHPPTAQRTADPASDRSPG
jgi:enamine deaminase RidA (YjgF/YER057c/UK114 family)